MSSREKLFEEIHNYTKYKLVEMLINRLNDGKTKLDDLNSIENLSEDILDTLTICGLKFYSKGKNNVD